MSTHRLVVSPRAQLRLEQARAWLDACSLSEQVLVLGASRGAAVEAIRRASFERGASFGWVPLTLGALAAQLAGTELASRGLVPAGALAAEAVCARVLSETPEGQLGRFAAVRARPGMPGSLSRTLLELRQAQVDPDRLPDGLQELHRRFEEALAQAGLADRARLFELAAAAVAEGCSHSLLDRPLLLLDPPVNSPVEGEFLAAISARAPRVLATAPVGDSQSSSRLAQALGVEFEILDPDPGEGSLQRLQHHLFADEMPPAGDLGEAIEIFSAPGEGRECLELARRIHRSAQEGLPFDQVAILLRAHGMYRSHLEEALRRAEVPAWFARGSLLPDPSGRAFLALLSCKAEGLSARRFSEYLSLGEVPDADEQGAPPPPLSPSESFVTADDELVCGGTVAQELPDPENRPLVAPSAPVQDGTLRVPRRWETLLIEASVIGGVERWKRRLAGLGAQLASQQAAAEPDSAAAARVLRARSELAALQAFSLPLLERLENLPQQAPWSSWLDALEELATCALRSPQRVLGLLSELRPMGSVGPVTLTEVQLVLQRRLTELVEAPRGRRHGKVFVGPIEAARGLSFKKVFVPGLAEKIFPQKVVEDPILLDRERHGLDADLADNESRAGAERLALRLAVGAAIDKLVLSWSRVDSNQARVRVPSFYGLELVRAARGMLPGFDELARQAAEVSGIRMGWPAPSDPADAIDEAEHDLSLFRQVRRRTEAEAEGTLRYLLSVNPFLARSLRTRGRRWDVPRYLGADGLVAPRPEAAQALARHGLAQRSFSATAIQDFVACPYRFVLKQLHRLSPRVLPEPIEHLDPLSRGSLVHDVQFRFLSALRDVGRLPVRAADFDRARRLLDETLDSVASEYEDELAPAIPRVWQDSVASIRTDLVEWLRRLAADPTWTPHRFELAFGLSGDPSQRDPLSVADPVPLDCGIALRGSIDLVERREPARIRVTDYKTGRASVKPGSVVSGGRALQPVFYALAAEKLFPDHQVEGGRLWYCTARGGFEEVEVPLDDRARESAQKVADVLAARIDTGRLPAAPDRGACRWCDFVEVCGPHEEFRTSRKRAARVDDLVHLRGLK